MNKFALSAVKTVLIFALIFSTASFASFASSARADDDSFPNKVDLDIHCTQNSDCRLINIDLKWACCWAGSCGLINHSLNKWVAVNGEWFEKGRSQNCPPQESCGPAPMCPIAITPPFYTASCQDNLCTKVLAN